MDLSELNLDEETKVKVLALHEADILGLKSKNRIESRVILSLKVKS